MRNLWNEQDARRCQTPLALRAYTSRLIGSDRDLVLCGGGNTSLKTGDVLYVKGTGAELADVRETHFTALDLSALRALLDDESLSDEERMRRVDDCKHDAGAPKPSIETLLHAALPHAFVEHAHADAVLAVANVEHCESVCAGVFGRLAPVVPYRHSGAALARACREVYQSKADNKAIGLILAFHGVVAFGHDAQASYENLLRLNNLAEQWLQQHDAWNLPNAEPFSSLANSTTNSIANTAANTLAYIEALRKTISEAAGFDLNMRVVTTAETLAFAQRKDLFDLTRQGPPTPQHAVYTRRVPLLGGDVAAYIDDYRDYLQQHLGPAAAGMDATPRIAINPDFGFIALGITQDYADIAADIFMHDIAIMTRASAHGSYRAASAANMARAELEYGGFEQRLRRKMED